MSIRSHTLLARFSLLAAIVLLPAGVEAGAWRYESVFPTGYYYSPGYYSSGYRTSFYGGAGGGFYSAYYAPSAGSYGGFGGCSPCGSGCSPCGTSFYSPCSPCGSACSPCGPCAGGACATGACGVQTNMQPAPDNPPAEAGESGESGTVPRTYEGEADEVPAPGDSDFRPRGERSGSGSGTESGNEGSSSEGSGGFEAFRLPADDDAGSVIERRSPAPSSTPDSASDAASGGSESSSDSAAPVDDGSSGNAADNSTNTGTPDVEGTPAEDFPSLPEDFPSNTSGNETSGPSREAATPAPLLVRPDMTWNSERLRQRIVQPVRFVRSSVTQPVPQLNAEWLPVPDSQRSLPASRIASN